MSATTPGAANLGELPIANRQRGSGNEPTRLEIVPRKPPSSEGVSLQGGIVERAAAISIDEIYRAPEAGTELGTALHLLRNAASNCRQALDSIREEPIRADAAMLSVRVLLPELFCCRAIGDGFAEIINAIQSAFENLGGGMFSAGQVEAILKALIATRNEPRMSFEKALAHVSAMEEVGLLTEPSNIDVLAEWLDD
jgi:hypothetical protein